MTAESEKRYMRRRCWLVAAAPLVVWTAYYGSFIHRANHAPTGLPELIEVACRADRKQSIRISIPNGGYARGYSCTDAQAIPPLHVLWASAIVWKGRPMLLETIVSCEYRADAKVLPVQCSTSTNGL